MGRSDLQKLLEQKQDAKRNFYGEYWTDPVIKVRGARQATVPAQVPDSVLKEPLLIIFTTNEKSNHEMVFKLLEGLLILPLRVVIVSEDEIDDSTKLASGKVVWFNPENGKRARELDALIMAADMAAVFDEKQSTIDTLFDKGVVIIGHAKSPLLENYHPNDETGNSFTYTDKNPWGVFAAIVRACETFRFPYDWQHIIRGILKVR
jgi:hypothetical protein